MAGSIVKRGPNKYLVRLYLGLVDGKRKYHSKIIHGNKKTAQQYLNKILREKDLGELIKPSRELLAEHMNEWLEKEAKTRVRAKTYQNYKDMVNLYINPALGDTILSNLTPTQIKGVYSTMIDKGLSPKTVKNTHGVLRNALEQAVKWGKLNRNPAELVSLPRQNKQEMKVLTPEQTINFLDAVVNSRWKALFSLLVTTGMRPSEALGLKWKDVELENERVTVNRTLTKVDGRWFLEEPKTSRSRRSIPIPSGVVIDLEEHKKEQAAEKLKAKEGEYTDHGFVFATKNGSPLDKNNIVNRYFKPLLLSADLPIIRLYDLRHTCATLLLSAGVNPKIVSERLGHASITLTMDTYSHVLPDMQKSATDILDTMLFTE